MKVSPAALWAAWSVTTGMMLFATSTPVHADFAPTLLVLMVGAVGTLTSVGSLLATISAIALLVTAAALHRIDSLVLYLGCVSVGWLIGYLMRTQRALLAETIHAQQALAITPRPTSAGASPVKFTTSSPTR